MPVRESSARRPNLTPSSAGALLGSPAVAEPTSKLLSVLAAAIMPSVPRAQDRPATGWMVLRATIHASSHASSSVLWPVESASARAV